MSEDIGNALRVICALFLIAFLISINLMFFVVGTTCLEEGSSKLEQCVTSVEDVKVSGIIVNEEGSINVIKEPTKSSIVEPLSWKVILNNLDTPDALLSYEASDWVYWAIGFTLKMTLVSLLAGFIVPIIAYKVDRLFGGPEYESECSSN